MRLWAMPCRATQDGRVMAESSDKTWPTGEGNGKLLQYFCLEKPMNSMKRQKEWHWKMNSPGRLVTSMLLEKSGEITAERMKREAEWKQCPVLDVTGDGSQVQCGKEQYCIETWNIRFMNQGKLDMTKQEMAKSEYRYFSNQWTKMDWNGWI